MNRHGLFHRRCTSNTDILERTENVQCTPSAKDRQTTVGSIASGTILFTHHTVDDICHIDTRRLKSTLNITELINEWSLERRQIVLIHSLRDIELHVRVSSSANAVDIADASLHRSSLCKEQREARPYSIVLFSRLTSAGSSRDPWNCSYCSYCSWNNWNTCCFYLLDENDRSQSCSPWEDTDHLQHQHQQVH